MTEAPSSRDRPDDRPGPSVLVTGVTGFIGSRLALRCLGAGLSVRGLGLERGEVEAGRRRLVEEAGGEVVVGSVTSTDLVASAVEDVDLVFHLAAVQHEMNVPDERFRDVNVGGTRRLVEAARDADVGRLVHGSTIGVYGDAGTVDDETEPDPENVYGATKLAGEREARAVAGDLPLVVVRIPETYGPGDRRLLKLFRGLRDGTFPMIGRGENLHHPVYVGDLVDGLLLAAERPEAAGETFVLPGAETLTTRDMVRRVAEAVDAPFPRIRFPLGPCVAAATVLETVLRPLGVQPPLHRRRLDFFRRSFRVESDRMARMLGYRAETPFREGARATARWYRSEGLL